MSVLPVEFYQYEPTRVAQALLGKRLVRRSREGMTAGRIVEVEAYLSDRDPACHASRGPTRSNAAMFGPAGRAYVYPIHSRYCLNAVTQQRGVASAVLIRAIEPIEGVDLMQRRRGTTKLVELARGPGRLCQALDIDRRLDHWHLTRGDRLWIDDSLAVPEGWAVARSVRIGVTSGQAMPLRYYVIDSPYVSGTRQLNASGQRVF